MYHVVGSENEQNFSGFITKYQQRRVVVWENWHREVVQWLKPIKYFKGNIRWSEGILLHWPITLKFLAEGVSVLPCIPSIIPNNLLHAWI